MLQERVETALVEVRQVLKRDGGGIELVEVTENGIVKVRMTGACRGCPMMQETLEMGVGRRLKEQVPEVTAVVAVE